MHLEVLKFQIDNKYISAEFFPECKLTFSPWNTKNCFLKKKIEAKSLIKFLLV